MFSFQHYVYYILIMTTNIFFFISVLRSLGLNHEKKKFPNCYYVYYIREHDKCIFLFCCCVHYIVISTTFTTPWFRKNIFQLSFQYYVHYVLLTNENKFIFIPTIRSLRDKFSDSIRFVQAAVISPSGFSVES